MPSFSTTLGADEYVSKGAIGVGGKATFTRKYDLPGLITFQERAYALLDNILMNSMDRVEVSDPEARFVTRNEAPIAITLSSDDTDTNFEGDTLRMPDAQARFLQPGDVLEVSNVFCDSDGANYTTTKFGSGYMPESIHVESVVESGASAGVANVFVKRGNGKSTAANAAGTVTTILSEYTLKRMQNALADGANAPTPVDHEPFDTENFPQFFSVTWGETSIETETDVYGKETMEQKAVRKRRDFFRQIEFALFWGRKGKTAEGGYNSYKTGGLVEFIPATAAASLDNTARISDFGGAFDIERQRELDEEHYRFGNAMQVKHRFCAPKYLSALYNALEKSITVNDAFSNRYGWKVMELELGHGVAMLHRHPMFTDQTSSTTDYSRDYLNVDLEFVSMMIMRGHNVQVKKDIQAKRAHRKEDELFCMKGLYRRFPDAHSYVYGITG